jgi:hypothetical protein
MPSVLQEIVVPADIGASKQSCTRPRIAFRVGGTSFGLFPRTDIELALDPELRDFAIAPSSCDVRVGVSWTNDLAMPPGTPRFHSGGLWSVFDESGGHQFYFLSSGLGSAPYKTAWFDPEFTHGELVLFRPYFDTGRAVYPLGYPLDELLMIHRLGRGEGVELHASGVVDRFGRGHLFLGHSGAGKSTAARIWQNEPDAQILSDDRIILRLHGSEIWIYGTPWHGDAGIASPSCAPLSQLYLLQHGEKTELVRMTRARAAAELMARSFVPQYSAQAIQFSMGFIERVACEVPCHLLRFLPDRSVVEAAYRAAA